MGKGTNVLLLFSVINWTKKSCQANVLCKRATCQNKDGGPHPCGDGLTRTQVYRSAMMTQQEKDERMSRSRVVTPKTGKYEGKNRRG